MNAEGKCICSTTIANGGGIASNKKKYNDSPKASLRKDHWSLRCAWYSVTGTPHTAVTVL
eukprot:1884004-Amphidinium_carterae.1